MQTNTITSEALPGLALRSRLALARVQKQINPDAVHAALGEIWNDARAAGFRAYQDGKYWPSKLIEEEPLLLRAWRDGQDAANWDCDSPIPF